MSIKSKISDLFNLSELKDQVFTIIEAKFELKKMELQEKAESGMAELGFVMILALIGVLIVTFSLILLGWLISHFWLGEPWGFVLILVLLIGVLMWAIKLKSYFTTKLKILIQKETDRILK